MTGVALAALASCGASDDKAVAELAINDFHSAVNAGDYDAIYAKVDAQFLRSTPGPLFNRLEATVARKLGPYRNGRTINWVVNYTPTGTQVILTRQATYARGPAVETFRYTVFRNEARLSGYNISSLNLILDDKN